MSFVFGIALPNFAIILADTRLNMSFKDGSKKLNDNVPIDLILPDGTKWSYGDKERKFIKCLNGFAATAGHALWGNFVLRNIAKLDVSKIADIQNKIGSFHQDSKNVIASIIPDSIDEIDKTVFLIITHSNLKPCIYALDSKGCTLPLTGEFYFFLPPDINEEAHEVYQKQFLNGFANSTNTGDFINNIKLLTNIQSKIARSSSLVSRFGEIGIIRKVGITFMCEYLYIDAMQNDASIKKCISKKIWLA